MCQDYDPYDGDESQALVKKGAPTQVPQIKLIHPIAEKIAAQLRYCQENELPHFAPGNGICWSCGNQIYHRISLERASTDLITGCPYCCRSYCD